MTTTGKSFSAAFARLRKSPAFWLSAAGVLLLSLLSFFDFINGGASRPPEALVFGAAPMLHFICPVFICLFQEQTPWERPEYDAFLVGMAACVSGSVLLALLALLFLLGLGCVFVAPVEMGAGELLYGMLCCLLAVLPVAAVCVCINTCIRRRSAGAALALVLVLLSLLGGSLLDEQLSRKETTPPTLILGDDKSMEVVEGSPNPEYVGGTKRKILEFVYDLLPTGQLIRAGQMRFEGDGRWPLFSIAEAAVLSAAGAGLFCRKKRK